MTRFTIPRPVKAEHKELHAELVKATKLKGAVGDAARAVASLLHPHFIKEEEYALPPLGLLPSLAAGTVTSEMRDVLTMTDRLKAELPQMLAEHKSVVAALRKLAAAARRARRPEIVHFTQKLMLHAQSEEQVLYPAAILVGEHVRARLPE
jgi:hypothetical protein